MAIHNRVCKDLTTCFTRESMKSSGQNQNGSNTGKSLFEKQRKKWHCLISYFEKKKKTILDFI